MITHWTAPPIGIRNVRAIDGRLMLTMEASSAVMNVPRATSASTAHFRRRSCARRDVAAVIARLGSTLGSLVRPVHVVCALLVVTIGPRSHVADDPRLRKNATRSECPWRGVDLGTQRSEGAEFRGEPP